MNKFFRENIIGILVLSAAGSLIATWLTRFVPMPSAGDASLITAASRPIPAWTLFPYSVLLVLAFAIWALRTRHQIEQKNLSDQASLRDRVATVSGERDAARQQVEALTSVNDAIRQKLAEKSSSTVSRADLMRFVAVVLSTAQGSSSSPVTHEFVCKHVAGLAGEGVPHAAISEALGAMLHIGAVASDYRGLLLDSSWKLKMRDAGIPDVVA